MAAKAADRVTATLTQVERLERKISQFQARRDLILARQREIDGKRSTRCKILIGAGLVALVSKGDEEARAVYRRIRGRIPESTARAFEGWVDEPVDETAGEGSPGDG